VTEIRFDVDLDHPPERVWRALTDPRQLGEWFVPVDVDPADRNRLRLLPRRLDGLGGPLDVRVVAAESPSRLVMRWQGDDLHVRVAITVTPAGDGSRLTFVQRGFLGRRGTLRRRLLRGTYGRLFAERLPRALDRYAGQEPTVLLAARVPAPVNARAARRGATMVSRRNAGGFRVRRVRRAELPPVDTVDTVPRGRHWAPEPHDDAPALRPAVPRQGGAHAVAPAATGRAPVPWASAGRRRAVAVPYRRGGGHRSIRRLVAVRSIADQPTRPLHAAGARRRLEVVSHSASPLRAFGHEVGAWLRSIRAGPPNGVARRPLSAPRCSWSRRSERWWRRG
jgi:uncharacterized protein YndB with AHSA1/START domain